MNLKGQNPSGIFLKAFLCEKYSRERSVLSAVMYLEWICCNRFKTWTDMAYMSGLFWLRPTAAATAALARQMDE